MKTKARNFEDNAWADYCINHPTSMLIVQSCFKVVRSCRIFFRKQGLILSEVFSYMKRSKNFEKEYFMNRNKKFTFLRKFDRGDKCF